MSASHEQILEAGNLRVRARWLRSNALRLTFTLPGEEDFPSDRPWLEHILQSADLVYGEVPEIFPGLVGDQLVVTNQSGEIVFRQIGVPRQELRSWKPFIDLDIPKTVLRVGVRRVQHGISMALGITVGEGFYGFGEWFNAFQRRSGSLRMRIRDAFALLQERHTYSAIPIFLSSRGYAFWLFNSHPSRWKIDPQRSRMEIEAEGPGVDYLLIYGPQFKRILETYTALTGKPPLLPRWAFGLLVTGYPQEEQGTTLDRVAQHRQRGIPLNGVILDYHWEEAYHNFRWRRSLFPDPQGFIAGLQQLGVRLGLILTPFLNNRNRPVQKWLLNRLGHNLTPGLENDDERALPEYQDAVEKGYLAHPQARWWFGRGGMMDFSHPGAAGWWNDRMQLLYEQGVELIKNDDGEYLPENGRSAIGMDGLEYHNLYGFFYGRAIYEGMATNTERRPFIYARSVWAGSQRYPAMFLGDQKPGLEYVRSTIRAGLNLSLLGFAYWTPDVFGLDGPTSEETHMRNAQWGLLAPVARYFWRPPAIDGTRFPWSHGERAEANFRSYTELRYRLLPYLYSLARESWQSGLPIVRPLLLEFQDDLALRDIYDQVLLGDRLMLCPVTQPGAAARRICLPEGIWYDFWSDGFPKFWQGPREIEVPAPLERLPILVRGGSILPMGPVLQSIPDQHKFQELELHAWPPYPARCSIYDDDGWSQAYTRGEYAQSEISIIQEPSGLVVTISADHGSFVDQPLVRQVTLVLHDSLFPEDVYINECEFKEWQYQELTREIKVRLSCPTTQDTVVKIRRT